MIITIYALAFRYVMESRFKWVRPSWMVWLLLMAPLLILAIVWNWVDCGRSLPLLVCLPVCAGFELQENRGRTSGHLSVALECVWPGVAGQAGASRTDLAVRICAGHAGVCGSGVLVRLAAAVAAGTKMPRPLPLVSCDRLSGADRRVCPAVFALGIILSPEEFSRGKRWEIKSWPTIPQWILSWHCRNCAVLD